MRYCDLLFEEGVDFTQEGVLLSEKPSEFHSPVQDFSQSHLHYTVLHEPEGVLVGAVEFLRPQAGEFLQVDLVGTAHSLPEVPFLEGLHDGLFDPAEGVLHGGEESVEAEDGEETVGDDQPLEHHVDRLARHVHHVAEVDSERVVVELVLVGVGDGGEEGGEVGGVEGVLEVLRVVDAGEVFVEVVLLQYFTHNRQYTCRDGVRYDSLAYISIAVMCIACFPQLMCCSCCLGDPVKPPTESAERHVCIIQMLMIPQFILIILNFVAHEDFLFEGFFGIVFLLLLYVIQYKLTYQLVVLYLFISILFTLEFMSYFLLRVQNQINFNSLGSKSRYNYAVSILNFLFYLFCTIYCFYPYRQFKKIAYHNDPGLQKYFESQENLEREQSQRSRDNKRKNKREVDYKVQYGDVDQNGPGARSNRGKEQKGEYEVFKGQGVRIG